jgi:hypothetical protein
VLQAAAGQLAARDVLALGQASHTVLQALDAEVRAAHVLQTHAPGVDTLARFNAVLGPGDPRSVAALPGHLQAEPLGAVAGRVMALAPGEQQQAIQNFQAFDHGGEPTALLRDLDRAARDGPVGMRRREAALVVGGGAAAAAVRGGHNMQAVAQRMAVSGANALGALEHEAAGAARRAIDGGASIPDAARRAGVTSQPRLDDLNRHASFGVGMAAVRGGEHPQAVAERLGITHPRCILALNERAALDAVGQGQNVLAAAAAFNITERGQIMGLERRAAAGPGEQAVNRGDNVVEVVARLGIRAPDLAARLERMSTDRVGIDLVRQGESVRAVAERLGIRAVHNIARLAQAAAGELPADAPAAKRPRLS